LFGVSGLQFRRQKDHARKLVLAAKKLRASDRQFRDFRADFG
jgi:hypothetical protein